MTMEQIVEAVYRENARLRNALLEVARLVPKDMLEYDTIAQRILLLVTTNVTTGVA